MRRADLPLGLPTQRILWAAGPRPGSHASAVPENREEPSRGCVILRVCDAGWRGHKMPLGCRHRSRLGVNGNGCGTRRDNLSTAWVGSFAEISPACMTCAPSCGRGCRTVGTLAVWVRQLTAVRVKRGDCSQRVFTGLSCASEQNWVATKAQTARYGHYRSRLVGFQVAATPAAEPGNQLIAALTEQLGPIRPFRWKRQCRFGALEALTEPLSANVAPSWCSKRSPS